MLAPLDTVPLKSRLDPAYCVGANYRVHLQPLRPKISNPTLNNYYKP